MLCCPQHKERWVWARFRDTGFGLVNSPLQSLLELLLDLSYVSLLLLDNQKKKDARRSRIVGEPVTKLENITFLLQTAHTE